MDRRTAYRAGIALAVGTMLFLFWAIGALGIIGSDGDRADMMYLGVLAVAVIGALVARLRPRGMAVALVATAAAQGLVGLVALVAGLGAVNPRIEIVGLTGMFVALFLGAAWLFHRAAEGSRGGGRHA